MMILVLLCLCRCLCRPSVFGVPPLGRVACSAGTAPASTEHCSRTVACRLVSRPPSPQHLCCASRGCKTRACAVCSVREDERIKIKMVYMLESFISLLLFSATGGLVGVMSYTASFKRKMVRITKTQPNWSPTASTPSRRCTRPRSYWALWWRCVLGNGRAHRCGE